MPEAQTLPQLPQFWGSMNVFTQRSPQQLAELKFGPMRQKPYPGVCDAGEQSRIGSQTWFVVHIVPAGQSSRVEIWKNKSPPHAPPPSGKAHPAAGPHALPGGQVPLQLPHDPASGSSSGVHALPQHKPTPSPIAQSVLVPSQTSLKHSPPAQVSPAGQVALGPQRSWQIPFWHVPVVGQAWPHRPQLSGSLALSMQAVPQQMPGVPPSVKQSCATLSKIGWLSDAQAEGGLMQLPFSQI